MAGRGHAIWLPNSKVIVCLRPGENMTEEEIKATDEWFAMIQERHRDGQADSITGESEAS